MGGQIKVGKQTEANTGTQMDLNDIKNLTHPLLRKWRHCHCQKWKTEELVLGDRVQFLLVWVVSNKDRSAYVNLLVRSILKWIRASTMNAVQEEHFGIFDTAKEFWTPCIAVVKSNTVMYAWVTGRGSVSHWLQTWDDVYMYACHWEGVVN